MDTYYFIFFVLSILLSTSSSSALYSTLNKGSSLSVENADDVLISPNGVFSAGFYAAGSNAYYFALWFSQPSCSTNCTVVWMANRDWPVNGKRSQLSLLSTGNLILTDAGQSKTWSTETFSLFSLHLQLNDTGNLVLQNVEGVVLWQSFDSPTDTLLPLQALTRNTQLVSSRSRSNYSTGFYKLFFDNDNTLRLLYNGPEVSSLYWYDPWTQVWDAGRSTYNNSRVASFDLLGQFSSSDAFTFTSADYGIRLQRRLKIDVDGNIRLYSRKEGKEIWEVQWQAILLSCKIHGICGNNSQCSYEHDLGRKCSCLPGFKMKDHADWSLGCEPEFNLSCSSDEIDYIRVTNADFFGYDLIYKFNYTVSECKKLCSELCYCKGIQFRYDKEGRHCYAKLLLRNGHRNPSYPGDLYVKLPKNYLIASNLSVTSSGLDCSGEIVQLDRTYSKGKENGALEIVLLFAYGLGGIELCIFLVWIFLIRYLKGSGAVPVQDYHLATGFKRFTYSELKKATRNFSEELGRGAGGIVYKGVFSDNRVGAIKRLIDDAKQGEAEFLAEVSTIGKLNHMNLIEMWGYCAESNYRLLVYEYMDHRSLAENLSSNSNTLNWRKRFDIALGTARGLAYLHEECLEWILHCDVKPQNILLDSNYQPKVSDFGLSKLLKRGDINNSIFSKIRGTRGYMAPEWVFNQPITSKVDVYSYGIVVLELVTGRSPTTGFNATEGTSEIEHKRLVSWVRQKEAEAREIGSSWIEEIVDSRLDGQYELSEVNILVAVALKCVEEDRDARPTMSKVVEMLMCFEDYSEHPYILSNIA